MPSINQSFLHTLQDYYTKYHCFIETGTLNEMRPCVGAISMIQCKQNLST